MLDLILFNAVLAAPEIAGAVADAAKSAAIDLAKECGRAAAEGAIEAVRDAIVTKPESESE